MSTPRSVEEWAASINIAIGCKFYDPWGVPCHYPSDCPSHRAISVEMSAYAAEQVAQARAEAREEERKARAKLVEAGWGRRVHEDDRGL